MKELRDDTIEHLLRKLLFPRRDHSLRQQGDSTLKEMVVLRKANFAAAELELETRAWMRDFWTRSLVTWLALGLSIIALVFSYLAKQQAEQNRDPFDEAFDEWQRGMMRSLFVTPTPGH